MNKPGIHWITRLRVLSACAVVFLHVAATSIAVEGLTFTNNIFEILTRWCVPVFVMITGYLTYQDEMPLHFFNSFTIRIKKIAIPLIFWSAIFLCWSEIKSFLVGAQQYDSVISILKALLLGEFYYHLWYLYMLIGLYFISPITFKFVSSRPKNLVLIVVLALFLISFLFSQAYGGLPSLFKFVGFIPYLMLGAFLKKEKSINIPPIIVFSLSVFFFFIFGLLTSINLSDLEFVIFTYNYSSIFVVLTSVSIFLFFYICDNLNLAVSKFTFIVAELSFGIYLVHPLFLDFINYLGVFNSNHPEFLVILCAGVFVLFSSLITVFLFKKSKLLSRVV